MTDRPPTPHPAERARTIGSRGPATLLMPAATDPERVAPLLHHVHDDGVVSLLLPDEHALVTFVRAAPHHPVTTMVELTDLAPVPLREPVRGLLWITGRLSAVDPSAARDVAVDISCVRADPRLLDIGHGATMLQLAPLSIVVADADGTHSVPTPAYRDAEPDPFCHEEARWLRHLEVSHADVVHTLWRHLPAHLRGGHLRPLGLDRYGLRLRVESLDDDHDVRLAFSRPIDTLTELSAELRRLVGCPFLAHRT